MSSWYIYMIRCNCGSLYTGITTDIDRRFNEHLDNTGKGAKYLRGKAPLQLVYLEEVSDKSTALKLEAQLKKETKVIKEALASGKIVY